MINTFCNTLLAQVGAPQSLSANQWWITLGACAVVIGLMLVYTYVSRAGIIARATTKEAIRQPMFIMLMTVALFLLLINTVLPFFSMGDDVKMLKECGIATILICCLLLAVWTSSLSIAEEIEGKTAMTLLSKPITRRQFVIGKYLGVLQAVMVLAAPLVCVLVFLVYYKVGYDAREASLDIPDWFAWTSIAGIKFPLPTGARLDSVAQLFPGLVLIIMESAVLTAVSVAISTRLPMIVNMIVCFTIFVVGNLTPVLVHADAANAQIEFVQFMGQLIATVLPQLEIYSVEAVIATNAVVPPSYLLTVFFYTACYCAVAILLALILFEDRDLA